MAGWFTVCLYNFLETRSTLGEPQLAGGIVLKHVILKTPLPRAACDARARRLHKESPVSSKRPDTRAIAVRSEQYAEVYESDCSNCKCRRRNNFIKRTNSVLVRRVQSASRYISRLIRSMVCHVVERVTTNHDEIAQPGLVPANDRR